MIGLLGGIVVGGMGGVLRVNLGWRSGGVVVGVVGLGGVGSRFRCSKRFLCRRGVRSGWAGVNDRGVGRLVALQGDGDIGARADGGRGSGGGRERVQVSSMASHGRRHWPQSGCCARADSGVAIDASGRWFGQTMQSGGRVFEAAVEVPEVPESRAMGCCSCCPVVCSLRQRDAVGFDDVPERM